MSPVKPHAVLAALVLVASCMGCSAGQPCSVFGTVTFEGRLIENGAIRFSTEDETPGPGGLSPITNGEYKVDFSAGMKAGKYLVIIYGFKETGRMIKVDEISPEHKEVIQYLPRRYNDASGERAEFMPGENMLEIALTK